MFYTYQYHITIIIQYIKLLYLGILLRNGVPHPSYAVCDGTRFGRASMSVLPSTVPTACRQLLQPPTVTMCFPLIRAVKKAVYKN